ncbi:MAG: NusA family KH domain protein, archaeal [uncultured archaeon A07HB70]|nr:MAG: NusA family KH domain protein, archaeal [uncultured archaeon A07HB70]
MRVTLGDRELRLVALFEDTTDATARDCLVYEDRGEVVFLVAAGEMGQAIGPDGRRVRAVEAKVDRDVRVVEDAPTVEGFVASALAPAVVQNVTVSEQGDRVAYVEVDPDDRGAAIGRDGRRLATARDLVRRHHDVGDVVLS